MSLEQTEEACAAVARAPRVSLGDIKNGMADFSFRRASECVHLGGIGDALGQGPLSTVTLCFVVMKNGYVVIGKSAPASPENFDAELGKDLAFEDAVEQLWPLMGFALRDKLAAAS